MKASHQRFVEEYLSNPTNASEAARRAGYTKRRAGITACELLKRSDIQAAIEQKQISLASNSSLADLLQQLMAIAKAPNTKVMDKIQTIRQIGLMCGYYRH